MTSPLRGPENSEGGGFAAADSLRRITGGCGPAPGFDKGTLARTLIGLCGQVTSLPDQRQAYGSSPLVKSLHCRCCRAFAPLPVSGVARNTGTSRELRARRQQRRYVLRYLRRFLTGL